MGNTVQLKKNGQPVFPVTDVSLVMGLQDAIKLPPVKVTTLPTASAETAGKMYYVGPDANDEYERYITSATGGSYEWIDLGDTSIPLPSIADNLVTDDANTALSARQGKVLNEEISELEHKVDELDAEKLDKSELIESETLYQESSVTTDTRHYVAVTPIIGQSYELKWGNATPNVSWIQLHTMNSANQTVEILANINKATTASGSVIVKPTLSGSVKFLVYLSGATADITLQKVDNYLDKLGDRISGVETKVQKQGEDISTLEINIQKNSVYSENGVSTDSQHRITHNIFAGQEYEMTWANATANTTRIQWKTLDSSNAIVENLADINKVQSASGSLKVKINSKYAKKFLIYLTGTTADITINKVVNDIGAIDGIFKKEELPFETGYFLNVEKDANGQVTLAHDTSNPAYMAALVDCKPGDVFLVNSVAGTLKALPFTFVDDDNYVIYQPIRYSTTGRILTYVTAPIGATKLAVNTSDQSLMSYKVSGVALLDNIKGLSLDSISQYQNDGSYESFRLAVSGNGGIEPTIVSVRAKYTASEDETPTIQFLIGDLYKSTAYVLGGEGEYKYQQFRIPPMVFGVGAEIVVNVPESCTLSISAFSASADNIKRQYDGFIGFDAHLGFSGIAPSNTMAAFELAAISGYNGCVCNPISSESGKLYCYHGSQSSLTQNGVTAINYSMEGFHALTDAQIEQLKVFGFGTHRYHYLEHLPALEEFLALCAKTGMRPVFSTHGPLQSGDIAGMKTLAVKYNLLDKLTIKSFDSSILESMYSAFGDSVYGYVYDIGTIVEGTLENAYSTMDSIVPPSAKCNRTIEIIASQATAINVADIFENGFKVGVYSMEEERDGKHYLELIGFGVTTFTDDNTPCTGLVW